MSNGESKLGQLVMVLVLLLVIDDSSMIASTSSTSESRSDSSPALAGVAYRRQAFAKLRLLTFGVFLLLRVTGLLLRAGTGSATAKEYNNKRWNEKHGGCHLFHRRTRIIKLTSAAT
jgi:hypothetical protein